MSKPISGYLLANDGWEPEHPVTGKLIDMQIITEQPAELTFPACKPDFDVQRANARRYLYGDVPQSRMTRLEVQIAERMHALNIAVISRDILDKQIDQIEAMLATLISERDQLSTQLDREADHAHLR